MGDYFGHWLDIGKKLKYPPKVFSINWFRIDDNGHYIWPGFGDNIRVLKWIIDRVNDRVEARATPIGLMPHIKDLDLSGLDIPEKDLNKLFEVDPASWAKEVKDIEMFFKKFGNKMPKEILDELESLKKKLTKS